jgi:MFS family permease
MSDKNRPARIVLLVTAALCINFIDRGNLSTAAPLIQDDFHLTATQLGLLLSAFYYGYVTCLPLVGWLTDRFGAYRVLTGGVIIWSLSTLLTGFAGGFVSLLVLRIMLGVGESVGFPCASKVLASNVPVGQLGLANGVLGFGYLVGPALGTLIGGYLMAHYGWRPVFILFGALSLIWLWPWMRAKSIVQEKVEVAPADQPSFGLILRQRSLVGTTLGHFASNYTFYFILSWLPFYLVKARGFSMETMAVIASSAYLLNALSALFMGWMADRWIRAGHSPELIYKTLMGFTHISGIACMFAMVWLPVAGSIAALFLFQLISGLSYPGVFAIPQIIAGPQAAGRWVGVQNGIANIAGLLAPWITGMLVDQTGRFDVAFALAALVNIIGFIGWVFVLPRIAPLNWAAAKAARGE